MERAGVCPLVRQECISILCSILLGMQKMPSMEGMDMNLETPNFVWNTLAPLVPNLVVVAQGKGGLGGGLGPQLGDLNSGS